jgi:hypothetical protein
MVVLDADGATMCGDDVGDDGQPESCAAGVAGVVEADEALHDAVALRSGDAGTVVGDGQRHRVCPGGGLQQLVTVVWARRRALSKRLRTTRRSAGGSPRTRTGEMQVVSMRTDD